MTAEELFKAICELIPGAMERHRVPGVAFGIVADGREFTAGFGVTNVRHPLPVDDCTLFQIGSITKTFTATAIARLAEKSLLDVDEPVRRYLPEFKMHDADVTQRATVRHLLVHTGGWQGDYFEDTGMGDDALKSYVAKMAELPQITPLGSAWSYNNSAFSVAGRVIEAVTGKAYESALAELVLSPLGLNHTYIFPADVMTHRFAVGHAAPGNPNSAPNVLRPWGLPRSVWAAGGLIASLKDMLRYARFHLGDGTNAEGTRVTERESIESMQTPRVQGEFDQKMGLGWRTRDVHGARIAFHMGGTHGQTSMLTLDRSRNFAFSFLTNSGMGGLLMGDVSNETFPKFTGFRTEPPKHIAMTAEQLREYAGRYCAALTDVEVKFGEGDQLISQTIPKGGFPTLNSPPGPTGPPTRIAFIGADHLITLDPPFVGLQAQFLRDDSGRVVYLRINGRIHVRE